MHDLGYAWLWHEVFPLFPLYHSIFSDFFCFSFFSPCFWTWRILSFLVLILHRIGQPRRGRRQTRPQSPEYMHICICSLGNSKPCFLAFHFISFLCGSFLHSEVWKFKQAPLFHAKMPAVLNCKPLSEWGNFHDSIHNHYHTHIHVISYPRTWLVTSNLHLGKILPEFL